LPEATLAGLLDGSAGDPFARLGPHGAGAGRSVTVLLPGAAEVVALAAGAAHRLAPAGGAEGLFRGAVPDGPYRLRAQAGDGAQWEFDDPYRFGPCLDEGTLSAIAEGRHPRIWTALGAHPAIHEGVRGTRFAVRAPHARRVSVVGDWNLWDGRRHLMRPRTGGIWEFFVPDIGAGAVYKYEILGADGALLPPKADPVGFGAEAPPGNASVVRDISAHDWADGAWMAARAGHAAPDRPVSIYEVHLGSWMRDDGGRPISYGKAAVDLVAHAARLGFTHIELLPIAEHPFDGSWGYQPVGLFAPTARHGDPQAFRALIDAAHGAGLGVILDWVPAHFPGDPHGLGRFDGTPLYEYADPREGHHPDWDTLIYDWSRPDIRNFLVSNARYWLEAHHADGLRVDAVASMLHRDYSRADGDWIPNVHGGWENLEAIATLREMNATVAEAAPGAVTIAEESANFPGVTAAAEDGGLGFGYKCNMGWTHDALAYISCPPAERGARHHALTFGLTYAFDDRFVLALSHDEVVHGKGSLLGRMPGDASARFANLRAFYGFMWGHPGKKLLFMGGEFGQEGEWNHDGALDWAACERPAHAGVERLVADLNALYRGAPALHVQDCAPQGFRWIEADDTEGSVYAWLRFGRPGDAPALVVCNFSEHVREGYRLGLPHSGRWREALNTDADIYGGRGLGNMGGVEALPHPSHGMEASAALLIPPLSTLIFLHDA
jgi:1,4-alpha-glucan branching enzyme